MTKLVKNKVKLTDTIASCVQIREFRQITGNVKLNELARILVRNKFVLVDEKYMCTIADLLHELGHSLKGEPSSLLG